MECELIRKEASGGAENTSGKEKAVRAPIPEAERMRRKDERGCGNGGLWKTRKTKSRFSIVSHSPWKSPKARFPHSHSPHDWDPPYKKANTNNEEPWKSGNPKAGFPLFHGTKKKTRKEGLA